MTGDVANQEQAEFWNGKEGAHWVLHEDRYEAMLAPFTHRLVDAAGISPTDRVLDVGCGSGSTTRSAGRRAVDGDVLGVDLSGQLLERAEERARAEGLSHVRFERADVQVHRFADEAFDAAISRFGMMFFSEPVTAFANVARALRPGGRMAFLCWAELMANEWVVVPGAAAAEHVPAAAVADPDTPGPFSLASTDRLRSLLDAAGFTEVGIEQVSEPLLMGSDPADTVEFLKATGLGQRLLRDADAPTRRRVTGAMTAALDPYQTADGVRLGSQAWLVTARRPPT